MDLGLDGRVALVTGGSNGIGRAIALGLAGEGARVALTYNNNADAAAEVVDQIDGDAIALPMNLGDPASIEAAVDATVEEFGGIDVLVVNAVRWPTVRAERFEDLPVEEWQDLLRSNLEGAFATVRAVLPAMRGRELGRIVMMSSGIAEEGFPNIWPYGAAKAGLHGFARSLAWDLGREGILVNVVGTGFTATERNRRHFSQEMRDRVAAATPQKQLSSPEDVARLVVYLASAANTSVTGEVIREGTSNARTALAA
jgi:NAD(P)-dependent dehydrogenase (short-subunit alcohol dehydrogenase family)